MSKRRGADVGGPVAKVQRLDDDLELLAAMEAFDQAAAGAGGGGTPAAASAEAARAGGAGDGAMSAVPADIAAVDLLAVMEEFDVEQRRVNAALLLPSPPPSLPPPRAATAAGAVPTDIAVVDLELAAAMDEYDREQRSAVAPPVVVPGKVAVPVGADTTMTAGPAASDVMSGVDDDTEMAADVGAAAAAAGVVRVDVDGGGVAERTADIGSWGLPPRIVGGSPCPLPPPERCCWQHSHVCVW